MEHIALSVYIGEEGLRSNFYMRSQATDADVSLFQEHERLLQQDCLQCIFDEKDMLDEEEVEAIRNIHHGCRNDPGFIQLGNNILTGFWFQLAFEQVFILSL